MYLDSFSAPTNKKKKRRIPNAPLLQLQLRQLQPRRVFTLMLSDLCGHFKPCGKDLEVLKDLSTWCHGLVRQPRETAWFDVRSDGNVAHLSAVYCDCWGGKRREGECYLISLNITLHRVQLHHKKSRKETSWSWTRERTFKRKGLRKRIKSVPCSLICKKMFSVMKDCGYFCWWEQLPRFLLVILRPLTCVRTTNK